MSKFHINGKGVPAPCKAQKGNCPFGGADSHFDTVQDAQVAADKRNENTHGILPEVTKSLPTAKELRSMRFQEGKLTLKDGTVLEGEITGNDDNSVSIKVDGNYNEVEKVDLDNLANIETTSDKTYGRKYFENLRSQNKARPKFRFNKENLEAYKGKFVQVDYDGKSFGGQVIDTRYNGINDNGLIIQSEDGEVKHIKDYRISDMETTGDNYREHKQTVRLKDLETEIENEITPNYDIEPESSEFTEFQSPTEEVDKYFKAVIDNKRGANIDLDKIDYDWTEEVEDSRAGGGYDDSSRFYHDFDKGGGQWAEWSDSSQEAYDEDLDKAEKIGEFYDERKDAINDMVKKVESIDWTKYYDSQEEGEIEALEYLKDIGIATDI